MNGPVVLLMLVLIVIPLTILIQRLHVKLDLNKERRAEESWLATRRHPNYLRSHNAND